MRVTGALACPEPGRQGHGHSGPTHDEVSLPGLQGANATPEESAELSVLSRSFETLTREVTNLPDVMVALISQMTGTIARVEIGENPQNLVQGPTRDIFSARGEGLTSHIQVTNDGIVVVQTSTAP